VAVAVQSYAVGPSGIDARFQVGAGDPPQNLFGHAFVSFFKILRNKSVSSRYLRESSPKVFGSAPGGGGIFSFSPPRGCAP